MADRAMCLSDAYFFFSPFMSLTAVEGYLMVFQLLNMGFLLVIKKV